MKLPLRLKLNVSIINSYKAAISVHNGQGGRSPTSLLTNSGTF